MQPINFGDAPLAGSLTCFRAGETGLRRQNAGPVGGVVELCRRDRARWACDDGVSTSPTCAKTSHCEPNTRRCPLAAHGPDCPANSTSIERGLDARSFVAVLRRHCLWRPACPGGGGFAGASTHTGRHDPARSLEAAIAPSLVPPPARDPLLVTCGSRTRSSRLTPSRS